MQTSINGTVQGGRLEEKESHILFEKQEEPCRKRPQPGRKKALEISPIAAPVRTVKWRTRDPFEALEIWEQFCSRLPQLEFHDLAARGHRISVHEYYTLRDFES